MENYNVTGMSCAACSQRVEKAVSSVDGVDFCSVNLLTNSMTVEGNADQSAIIDAVIKAGYGATLKDDSSPIVVTYIIRIQIRTHLRLLQGLSCRLFS